MKKFFAFALLILTVEAMGQRLSDKEKLLIQRVEENYEEMLGLLEETVNINSGTLNLNGVREVGRIFEREFQTIGFETEWVSLPDSLNRAGHFVATKK
ncbi:hypothetical protein [Pararhodonellum marinum]|uniref:hypothetical protein n=1 Tax=Pararhodonellum marinum TaxID=2755358 RepID=UPI00293BD54D|nr:hypothetical protein [Pararhodonellum marinum]